MVRFGRRAALGAPLLLQLALLSSLVVVGDTSSFLNFWQRGPPAEPAPARVESEVATPPIVVEAVRVAPEEAAGGAGAGGRWWGPRGWLCCCLPFRERDELSSHKLWEQLDTKDELDRVRISLSTLSEVAAEQQLRDGQEGRDDVIEIRGMDSGGLHFPPPDTATLPAVQDVFHQLQKQRQHLHVDSFQAILAGVQPLLAASPNVVVVPSNQRVTVVGDIHGSLQDLAKIFELCGWPGPGNAFIFNGDFVDRGDKGVEVISTLFALKIMLPDSVFLNRGNHEDEHIGRAYGFFEEVVSKYGSRALYDRICDVFTLLPLCTIIEGEAFVVHAGLSRFRGTCLSHIGAIDRKKLRSTVKAACDLKTRSSPRSLLLLEDLLWSDPSNPIVEPGSEKSCEPNHARGAGTKYGTQITREWLRKCNLKTLVRSHQCVPKGWDRIDCGEGAACWTVFSASDYDGGGNDGAVLVFEGGGSPRVVQYQTSPESCMRSRNKQRLIDLICEQKGELRGELTRVAGKRTHIRVGEWAEAMNRVLGLKVDFRPLRLELVGLPADGRDNFIDWRAFLERYRVEAVLPGGGGSTVLQDGAMEAIFKNRRELCVVFRLLDLNNDGNLGRDEIKHACSMLNKNLPQDKQIHAEDLFRIMARGNDGAMVSVDDFVACWRETRGQKVEAPL